MVDINLAFQCENGISFSETEIAIFSGTETPGAGIPAPVGSLYLHTSGLFVKTGEGVAEWNKSLDSTEVNISTVQPPAGLLITGGPISNSGTLTFALANDLLAVESLSTSGFAVRTGADSWTTRSIVGGQNISVSNGTGVGGNTTIAFTGILSIANGGTGLAALGSPLQSLRVNAGGSALEYYTPAGGGSVTSVSAAQPASGLTITGSPITTSGTLTFALANDLAALEALNGVGFAVRTGADSWANRSITGTSNQITVNNGSGAADPVISIASNPVIPGISRIKLPAGATADRPGTPIAGDARFNTTTNSYEGWNGSTWTQLSGGGGGSGKLVNVYTGAVPVSSGTSTVPYDNTVPLVSDGTEIWAEIVTPTNINSKFLINMSCTVDLGNNGRVLIGSIYRNNTNIGSAFYYNSGSNRPTTMSFSIVDTPSTLSAVTYSMRAGIGNGSGVWYINSSGSGRNLGGALVSEYMILETL